jgi:hypothetical protein
VALHTDRNTSNRTAKIAFGLSRVQVATSRRFQSPQPLRGGRIGGVVHLPTSTTWTTASASPTKELQSVDNVARLGSYTLQLPLRRNLPQRTTASCRTHRPHAHPPPDILQPIGSTPGALRSGTHILTRSINHNVIFATSRLRTSTAAAASVDPIHPICSHALVEAAAMTKRVLIMFTASRLHRI